MPPNGRAWAGHGVNLPQGTFAVSLRPPWDRRCSKVIARTSLGLLAGLIRVPVGQGAQRRNLLQMAK